MTLDAKAFAQAGYEVVPSANGGIILAGEEQNLAFTTPADFVEWLRDVYCLKSRKEQRDWLTNVLVGHKGSMKPYVTPIGLAPKVEGEDEALAKMYDEAKRKSLSRTDTGGGSLWGQIINDGKSNHKAFELGFIKPAIDDDHILVVVQDGHVDLRRASSAHVKYGLLFAFKDNGSLVKWESWLRFYTNKTGWVEYTENFKSKP